jgi:3-oxoacyl-[acyl-carrier protein] reductase
VAVVEPGPVVVITGALVDVAEAESVALMVQAAVGEWGRLDVLINNAGTFPCSRVVDLDLATWTRAIDVNLTGTFLGPQAAARQMIAQGRGGRIVNVASVSAFDPGLRQAHYAASKAGSVAFSRNLALEVAPYAITVNCLAPGLVKDGLTRLATG